MAPIEDKSMKILIQSNRTILIISPYSEEELQQFK